MLATHTPVATTTEYWYPGNLKSLYDDTAGGGEVGCQRKSCTF